MKNQLDNSYKTLKYLYILDKDTVFLAKGLSKKKTKVIYDQAEFEKFLNNVYVVNNIVVLVELNWNDNCVNCYGYEIAKILLNKYGNFNLLFISAKTTEIIFNTYKEKNRIFTQKFPHTKINQEFDLNILSVPEISKNKFNYFKYYCLMESGIIDRLEHDFRHLDSNNDSKVLKGVEDLLANSDILGEEIITYATKLKNEKIFENRKNIIQILHSCLEKILRQYNGSQETPQKKSHSVLMIIEDNQESLSKLKTIFNLYFHNVRDYQSGTKAYNEIKKNGKEYDAVITDMELLDGNFDDLKQGIDILELCENDFPFITTRIITGLPKNALEILTKYTGKKLNEIIFKGTNSDNIVPPFQNLTEFVRSIDNEVKQKKVLRSMPGPILSWWKNFLTKELYLTKIQNIDYYNEILENTFSSANKFINGDFDSLTNEQKISIEIKQTKKIGDNPDSGWEIIELLLTHRLIAIWFANKNNWQPFYFSNYINLSGFNERMQSKVPKTYYNSILGFHAIPEKNNSKKWHIERKNFFPHELKWLSELNVGNGENGVNYAEFFEYLIQMLKDIIGQEKEILNIGNAFTSLLEFNSEYDMNPNFHAANKRIFLNFYDKINNLPPNIENIIENIRNSHFE